MNKHIPSQLSAKLTQLLLSTLCTFTMQSPDALAAQKAAEWHPGHYLYIGTAGIDGSKFSLSSKFRGVEKLYTWEQLEPSEGNYQFGAIHSDLQTLKRLNKHLIVQFQAKAFGHSGSRPNNCTPSDLKGSQKAGGGQFRGTYVNGTGALDPVFWDPAVRARLHRLYVHLGQYLSADANASALESVCLSESAVSQSPQNLSTQNIFTYSEAAYIAALTDGFTALNAALQHATVIQYTNFISSGAGESAALRSLVSNERAAGVGLGGPDLCPPQYGHPSMQAPNGVYGLFPGQSNAIPLGIAVQSSDAVGEPQVTFRFGRDQLKLNYIYWLDRSGYIEQVAAMLNNSNVVPTGDPAGGLNSRYPASITPLLGN